MGLFYHGLQPLALRAFCYGVSRALVSAFQCRRLVKKARIIDLRDKKTFYTAREMKLKVQSRRSIDMFPCAVHW